ncbi:MAG: NPCBM/NEW2 domain-containing protein [Prolixibacteraceae bacterium]|nr:NPCBM/NEW2 domain-containing protein [Prolixibacteraceae bacterium]
MFGTHSNSIIEYNIPEGYATFTALAGLDKECVEHTEGATVKFHVFTVHPSGAEPKDSLKIDLDFQDIGLTGTCSVRDLWAKKDLGQFTDKASLYVKNHGSRLIRISNSE